jgi:hypothetical protein
MYKINSAVNNGVGSRVALELSSGRISYFTIRPNPALVRYLKVLSGAPLVGSRIHIWLGY